MGHTNYWTPATPTSPSVVDEPTRKHNSTHLHTTPSTPTQTTGVVGTAMRTSPLPRHGRSIRQHDLTNHNHEHDVGRRREWQIDNARDPTSRLRSQRTSTGDHSTQAFCDGCHDQSHQWPAQLLAHHQPLHYLPSPGAPTAPVLLNTPGVGRRNTKSKRMPFLPRCHRRARGGGVVYRVLLGKQRGPRWLLRYSIDRSTLSSALGMMIDSIYRFDLSISSSIDRHRIVKIDLDG